MGRMCRVVRAIAACPIPVVTGIGHERDESLADLAADIRAATPTAAAALVVPNLDDLVDDHAERIDRLRGAIRRVLVVKQHQLQQLRTRSERIQPDRQLALERERLASLNQRLQRVVKSRLQIAKQEQSSLKERCQALDPRLVLLRGYAVVRQESGRILRESDNLGLGEELAIQLGQGQIRVRVIEVDNGKK